MAVLTITIPDTLADWIESRVRDGDYRDPSDLVGDLVARERRRGPTGDAPVTTDELRRIVEEARSSGVSRRTVAEIVAEGDRIARECGLDRE